jgi:WD40 repeat protein/tetratricopeptide (TPR) repeat protein
MSEMINPYIAGAPVTEKSMFFGRQDVFDWVQRSLTGKFVDHILVIHGQRRVGKTSVLKQIPFHLPSTYIPVFFDLQGRTHTSLDRFLWRLAKEIARTVRTAEDISPPVPFREDFSRDPELFQNQFLPRLSEAIGDRRLLLLFDEFDSLEEPTAREMLAQDLIPYFSRLMQTPGPLAFIFSIGSSGQKLEHMQASYTDFFRIALYKKISFLEKEEALRLITQPVAGVIEYTPQAIHDILHITSGHPYFTQLLCHELFSQCQKSGHRRIAPQDIEAVLDDVVERGTVNLKFVWDDASDPERYVLTALSLAEDGRDPQSIHQFLQDQKVRIAQWEVADSLRHLQEKDVLASDNTFTVDLMRLWLLENKPLDRVIEELTEVSPIAARLIEVAQAYRDTGMPQEALNSYRSALEVDPQNLTAQIGIASIFFEQRNLPQAAEEYEKALEIDPEDIAARSGLCQTHLALGDQSRAEGQIEAALEHYRQILSINEQHLEAQERLAAYEELAGMYRQAQTALTEKRYDQAAGLLKEIIARDLRYKDASRLLAQAVELQRGARPLWKDIRVLAGAGGFVGVIIIALFLLRLPLLSPGAVGLAQTPSAVVSAAISDSATPTPTPSLTDTPAPSLTPTVSPTGEGCVLATAEILEGQNPFWYAMVGPARGCYEDAHDFLIDVGLSTYDFEPGTVITFWTQYPVDAEGALIYPTPTAGPPPPVRTLTGTDRVIDVAFSPDGQTLASASYDGMVILWDVETGQEMRTVELAGSYRLGWHRKHMAFSPDTQTLASGSGPDLVRLWSASDGALLHTLEGHTDEVWSVAFSPDGQTLASGSKDSTVRLWQVSDGTPLDTLQGHWGWAASVAFSPDGAILAAGSLNGTVLLWQVSDGTLLRTLRAPWEVLSLAFSPDGATLASAWTNLAGDDYGLILWDVESGEQLRTLTGHTDVVRSLALSPDGTILASASEDHTVRLWRVSDGASLGTLEGHFFEVLCVTFSPDGATLASGAESGKVMLWDMEQWAQS